MQSFEYLGITETLVTTPTRAMQVLLDKSPFHLEAETQVQLAIYQLKIGIAKAKWFATAYTNKLLEIDEDNRMQFHSITYLPS